MTACYSCVYIRDRPDRANPWPRSRIRPGWAQPAARTPGGKEWSQVASCSTGILGRSLTIVRMKSSSSGIGPPCLESRYTVSLWVTHPAPNSASSTRRPQSAQAPVTNTADWPAETKALFPCLEVGDQGRTWLGSREGIKPSSRRVHRQGRER